MEINVNYVVDMEISNDEVEINEVLFVDLDSLLQDTSPMAPTVGMEFKLFCDSLKYYTAYVDSIGFGVKIRRFCKITSLSDNLYKRATFASAKKKKVQ